WEMLVGRRLFEGETISHTLADVLRAAIDFSALPSDTPPSIRELLRRCLDRSTTSRLRDIGEARAAVQKEIANPTSHTPTVVAPNDRVGPSRVAWIVASLAIAALVLLAFVHFREMPVPAQPMRFQILPPEQTTFINSIVLSPDGRSYAFEGSGPDGRSM